MEIKRDKYLQDLKDRMHSGLIKIIMFGNRLAKNVVTINFLSPPDGSRAMLWRRCRLL